MSLRVALQIHDERAMRHLSSIISLAAKRASSIKLVDAKARGANAPEVIVVCEDEPGVEGLLAASKQEAAPKVVIYGQCHRNHPWVLPSPATAESLQRLLSQIVLAPIPSLPLEAANSDDIAVAKPLAPCGLLLEIARARTENRVLEILVDGLETFVYIDGKNDRVYATDAFDLAQQACYAQLLQVPAERWRWIQQLPRQVMDLQNCSLEAVIWSLAYAQSLPRFDDRLLQRTYFQLQRWPYFSEFHYTPEQLAWSAKLSRGAASLAQLQQLSAQPPQAVAAFYNACVYSGIAVASSAPTLETAAPSKGRGLLKGLLQRLRGA